MFSLALLTKQASTRTGHRFDTPTQCCTRRSPPKCAPPACGRGMPAAPWPLVALGDRAQERCCRAQARCCKHPSGPALSNGAQARCCKRTRALGRGVRKSCGVVRIPAGCVWILWSFLSSVQRLTKLAERLRLCDDWALNSMTVLGSATTMPFLWPSQALQQLYYEF